MEFLPGTGTISPLLANIALHGMETVIAKRFPTRNHKRFYTPQVIRYADDGARRKPLFLWDERSPPRECLNSPE